MKKTLMAILAALTTLASAAQVEFVKDGLLYKQIGENAVSVGKIDDKHKPAGKLKIPAKVKNDGVTYVVTALDKWGFFGCDQLTDISLPNTLKKIDIWALCKCTNIKKLKIPASVTEIGYAAFENLESITEIELPDGLTEVPERLLKECANLKSVKIPDSVTSIGSSAFSSCKELESIELPKNVESLGSYALAYNEKLTDIRMPESLKSIGLEAFSCCKALKSIVIPEGVTKLNQKAFNYCTALEDVTLPSTLAEINGNPFSSCRALKEYKIAENNASFAVVDGILFSKDMTRLIACPTNKEVGDYTVPASVKTIASYAFYDCSRLTSAKMTAVEVIAAASFHDCRNLASIDFGTKLKSLGDKAFYSCNSLKEVVLPSSLEHVEACNFDFSSDLKTVSVAEDLWSRERDFNNLSFQFCPDDLQFIIRLKNGGTKTATPKELNDMKKYFINR